MLNLKKRLNQQSLSEIWHITSIYLCFLSPALPDSVGLRAGREESVFWPLLQHWHLQFRMASRSPPGPGRPDHAGGQEHLLPSDFGTAGAPSLRCVPPGSYSSLGACKLACCNMLYLGLHLRPYGPSAALPYRGLPAARRGPDGTDDTYVRPSDSTLLGTWCAENGRL